MQANKNLLQSGSYSDFTIEVDGVKIPVHKAILSSVTYFERIFSSSTSEPNSRLLNITDFTVDVVQKLLEFICVGCLTLDSKFDENVEETLKALDKVTK